MDILAVCAVAVICAAVALLLRRQSQQTSLLISVGAGALIIIGVLENIVLTTDSVEKLLSAGGVNSDYIVILFKVSGICFVTEFTCDTLTEAGLLSLSTNVSFAGKITALMAALPMFEHILKVVSTVANTG